MKHILISGYNSFIGNYFYKKYKKKYKITYYKEDILGMPIIRGISIGHLF